MSDAERPCELCQLPVGLKPFLLRAPAKTYAFCCEGCRGIYEMLHQIKEMPDAPAQNQDTVKS